MRLAQRRIVRRVAVLGCAVAVAAAGVTVTRQAQDRSSHDQRLTAHGSAIPAILSYYADTRTALSPLLLYVRVLPKTIAALEAQGGRVSDTQVEQAGYMADSFATARDLVGRLTVPAQAPSGVGELMQIACELYRQSALSITELKTVSPGESGIAVLTRAGSLQAIADRVIDQVRRVLEIDRVGDDEAPAEYQFAPPVPALKDLVGRPAEGLGKTSSLTSSLRTAGLLIADTSSGRGSESPAAALSSLESVVAALEKSPQHQAEDVLGARLAIALALIAEQARVESQTSSVDAVLMLSNDLWNQARTLSAKPNSAIQHLGATKLSRSEVWTGGLFKGNPPPLKPGQDIGADVPGGLPKIDPAQILKG